MPCKKCGCESISVKIIDEMTAETRCALCGPSYIFKDPGKGWESPEERMARMRRDHICQNCKKPFHDYRDKSKAMRILCNPCSVWIPEGDDDIIKRSMARNNERSPWRLPRVFQKKG